MQTPKLGTIHSSNIYNTALPSLNLRIITWNIHRGFHIESIIHEIETLQPDILLLQEVDWGNIRTERKNIAQVIADALHMNYLYAPDYIEEEKWTRHLINNAGGGVIGNAILSKTELLNPYILALPLEHLYKGIIPSRSKFRLFLSPLHGGPIALHAQVLWNNISLHIYTTHLSIHYAGMQTRILQAKSLLEDTDSYEHVIIGGDFNTAASGVFGIYNFLENQDAFTLKNIWTSEAVYLQKALIDTTDFFDPYTKEKDTTLQVEPIYKAKLDWVLLKHLQTKDFSIGNKNYSDHKTLIVDILPPS